MDFIAVLAACILLSQSGLCLPKFGDGNRAFKQAYTQSSQYSAQGEFEKAIFALQQALSISSQAKLTVHHRKCLLKMAFLKWDLGKINESSHFFSKAQAAFRLAGDKRSEYFCSNCLEIIQVYNQAKEDRISRYYYRSLEEFDRAILLGRKTGFPDFELKCLRQQSLTFWDLRKFNLYLECNKRGLDLAAKINHRIDEGRFLNNIGVYYQKIGDYSQAAIYFESALSFIRLAGDKETEAECLNNLGILYREVGNPGRAHFFFESALEIDRKIGDPNSISIDLDNIGTLLLRSGIDNGNRQGLLEALRTFENSLSFHKSSGVNPNVSFSALNNIGMIQNGLKNYERARRYFTSAREIAVRNKDIIEECRALNNIGASYLYENNIKEALSSYEKSYLLASANLPENLVMESCLGLGQCYEYKQDYSMALNFYRKTIGAIESVRNKISSEYFKIGYARNKYVAYEKAIHIIAEEYARKPSLVRLDEIFNLVERAKAQAFLDSINGGNENRDTRNSLEAKERQQTITKNISELTLMLTDQNINQQKRDILKVELENEEEEYVRVVSDIKSGGQISGGHAKNDICSIREVQQKLVNKGTLLFEYFLGDTKSYLISISPTRASMYVLAGKRQIERSLRAYLKLISDYSFDQKVGFDAAIRIGNELIPLAERKDLEFADMLVVIPDEVLYYLPFETIRIRDEHDSKYLVENVAISYFPSASSLYALKNIKESRTWKRGLLAIGGPSYEQMTNKVAELSANEKGEIRVITSGQDSGLCPLPFSRKEIIEIAGLFPRDSVQVLEGESASETNIKRLPLQDFQFIHFACHGFLDNKYPFRSALILAAGTQQGEDGYLQMREVYDLSITANLVVLSACQTGQGVLERSEGPMALSRPFFFAGARSVISSLWPIDDKATARFMQEFYKNLMRGQSAVIALQTAKRKALSSSRSHPFFWASFMLQGDPLISANLN